MTVRSLLLLLLLGFAGGAFAQEEEAEEEPSEHPLVVEARELLEKIDHQRKVNFDIEAANRSDLTDAERAVGLLPPANYRRLFATTWTDVIQPRFAQRQVATTLPTV